MSQAGPHWSIVAVLQFIGVVAGAISAVLLTSQLGNSTVVGVAFGAVSAACIAASAYLTKQGYTYQVGR